MSDLITAFGYALMVEIELRNGLDLRDRQCPKCGAIGGGIVFYSNHWADCKMEREDMTAVDDIEYEEVKPKQLTNGRTI